MEVETSPPWEKRATLVVFVLVVLAFTYLGYAYYTQRTLAGLMAALVSADAEVSANAAAELSSTDKALPYLSKALVNSPLPETRATCAELIFRRLEMRRSEGGTFATKEAEQQYLRSGLNLEAITRALQDESAAVRARAFKIVETVGTEQNYQRTRRDEMIAFEALLEKLASQVPGECDEAGEGLREAGVRALPYLVGVVFSDEDVFRLRGLQVLRTVVQDVLRGSNQRRVVPLLGRRRCRLLLREMTRLEEKDRSVITDVLNVSGRVPDGFFTSFREAYAAADEAERHELLEKHIGDIEKVEKARPGQKIEDLSKAGTSD